MEVSIPSTMVDYVDEKNFMILRNMNKYQTGYIWQLPCRKMQWNMNLRESVVETHTTNTSKCATYVYSDNYGCCGTCLLSTVMPYGISV